MTDIPASALGPAVPFAPLPDDLVLYILNVGDGDSMVLQFPDEGNGRAYAVVDSNAGNKTVSLLDTLGATSLAFVCGTHPHVDHIRGLREVLRHLPGRVGEYWDSGFRFTSATFHKLITEVSGQRIQFVRPTSGYETFINGVRLTVLSPSIALRNRYDSYGVDVNNASVVLKVEYPSQPPISDVRLPGTPSPGPEAPAPRTRTAILGGDAQTDAWSKVLEEFPHLDRSEENWARLINARTGRQPLLCDVLKVSHHASKHGINLELVERMGDASGGGITSGPRYLLNSCGLDSTHGFPHAVAQEIMREVRQPIARSGAVRKLDHELGIHYTAQLTAPAGSGPKTPAGSIAVVFHKDASTPDLYRLGDAESKPVTLDQARRVL
jgi:beta-lactamase superfamily II metal-dependent hydrolase